MELTEEQMRVVEIDSGRHLVLAPPGSGKTEMLSQRIIRALQKKGIDPERMLCATFTNRAAFEMRERVAMAGNGLALPDVGNLHHFCHRFLLSVGRVRAWKHVLDEVEQLSFIREATEEVLHQYGNEGEIGGVKRELLAGFISAHYARDASPFPALLAGALIAHQHRIGFRASETRTFPGVLHDLLGEGIVARIERAYSGVKRRFQSVDFDDLVNETCLYLREHPLAETRQYEWVQIDEVQDLSPLQWEIVSSLTSPHAVSVYFGDAEQAIFSFLGASLQTFFAAVAECECHFFKTNFRATPLLLEVLMRYSIATMRSSWRFLPEPVDVHRANGRLLLAGENETVVGFVAEMLSSGEAENVAVLVRSNEAADRFESALRGLPYRLVKVSGIDLFTYAPMRDFLSFVSLFGPRITRVAWQNLIRRFSSQTCSDITARHLVRRIFAAKRDPLGFVTARFPPLTGPGRRELSDVRKALRAAVLHFGAEGRVATFRELFAAFAAKALSEKPRYTIRDLYPERVEELEKLPNGLDIALARAFERIEVFLRYTDHVYRSDGRDLRTRLAEDWDVLTKLKEADLLTGDERIVISTIHKAKGRQFDAVVIPDAGRVTQGGEEALRLLYVAMSRAKRHLALFDTEGGGPLEPVRTCFSPDYTGYYLRRSRGEDLSDDWLSQWEALAADYRAKRCDREVVMRRLSRPTHEAPLRMAIRTLRFASGESMPDLRRLLICPAYAAVRDAILDCARESRRTDAEFRAAARRCFAENRDSLTRRALFAYACFANDRKAIGDFVYAPEPEVRARAARELADRGDVRWMKVVTGSARDWKRLESVDDPEHEVTIRNLLKKKLPTAYEIRLRHVLGARALRR